MLEKDRFLAIRKLARDIREDNSRIFKSFEKLSFDKAVDEKEKFINSVIDNMNIAFSDGEEGREEKQIFRANLLIPDDDEFFECYSNDKNIRNLMNKYNVNIEDIMSKITELNVYNKYIDDDKSNNNTSNDGTSFVSEMVKISPKDAESLLDEIDNLSSVMEDLEPTEEKPELLKPQTVEVSEEEFNDSFDDITLAVSNFVDDYHDKLKQLEDKDKMIKSLQEEIENLKSNSKSCDSLREENELLKKENEDLIDENKVLASKLEKSAKILNKIYNSISKK